MDIKNVEFYTSPDGDVLVKELNRPVYVLSENEGWLHVLVPEGEIAPRISWRGTYGYVRADEVAQGRTLAELRWR